MTRAQLFEVPFTETNKNVARKFAERYPGITVEPFRVDNLQLVQRATTEAAAGVHNVDVIDLPAHYVTQLSSKGLIRSYPWKNVFGTDQGSVHFDGLALETYQIDLPLAYNTTMVKPGDIKSWDDLTDPKWRGKLIADARAQSFYILSLIWGEEKTDAFMRGILANRPTIKVGSSAAVEALAGGQAAMSFGTISPPIIQYKEKGAPIDWMRIGPLPTLIYTVLAMKNAPHPNAALLWTSFLATPEARQALWDSERKGMLSGPAVNPHGAEIAAAGLQLQYESSDAVLAARLIKKYVDLLSGATK